MKVGMFVPCSRRSYRASIAKTVFSNVRASSGIDTIASIAASARRNAASISGIVESGLTSPEVSSIAIATPGASFTGASLTGALQASE